MDQIPFRLPAGDFARVERLEPLHFLARKRTMLGTERKRENQNERIHLLHLYGNEGNTEAGASLHPMHRLLTRRICFFLTTEA